MAAWFLVELKALISGNLFCWKLSTYDLKFPGGRWPLKHMLSSPPSSLSSWLALCVFKDRCGEWHYKVSLPLYPFLFLDTEGKDQQGGLDLWVPRKLPPSQISDHLSPPRLLWGMFAGLQLWGRPGNECELPWELSVGSALCSLDS